MSFIGRTLAAATTITPFTPATYDDVFSGVNLPAVVTPDTAMAIPAVYACTVCISEDIAKVPLQIYRSITDGKELADQHPLYDLLHDQPNKIQTALEFREMMTAFALNRDIGGVAEIIPGPRGAVDQLDPAAPRSPPAGSHGRGRGPLPATRTRSRSAGARSSADEVFVLRGRFGLSVLSYARESFVDAARHAAVRPPDRTSGARGTPASSPGRRTPRSGATRPRSNFRKAVDEYMGEGERAGRPMFLEDGMTWQSAGITMADAEFLGTLQHGVADVCRWYRVPQHKVQELLRSTNNNIEQQSLDYVVDSLQAWAVRWEQAIKRDLIEAPQYFAKHNLNGLMRGDSAGRATFYATGIQWGYMTRAEVRKLEDLNPIEGLDEPLLPLNMTTQGDEEAQEPPQPAPQQLPAAAMAHFHAIVRDNAARIVRMESNAMARLAERTKGEQAKWEAGVRDFYLPQHADFVARLLRIPDEMAERYAEDRAKRFIAEGPAGPYRLHRRHDRPTHRAGPRLGQPDAGGRIAMKYGHVIAAVYDKPWAIYPATLNVIVEMLRFRAEGGRLTQDEIEARLEAAGSRQREQAAKTPGIAVLPLHGIIAPRAEMLAQTSAGGTGLDQFMGAFRAAMASPDVAAILLDVDSPGGQVDGVPEAAAEIRAARDKKPIIASANTMMASAAYWLASQASEIVASPSATVGSIGVLGAHDDMSGYYEQKGIKTELISAGRYKTEGTPYGPLTDEARAYRQEMVDQFYGMFVNDVAAGRRTSPSAVAAGYGEGRMLLAEKARLEGMIDRVETLDATVGRMAGAIRAGARSTSITATNAETLVDGWSYPPPEWAASAANWTVTEAAARAFVEPDKVVAGPIGRHKTGTEDGPWDGPANEARLPSSAGPLRSAHAWVDSEGDPDAKASYKFGHHVVGENGSVGAASTVACSSGIAVLNGGRGGTVIPASDECGNSCRRIACNRKRGLGCLLQQLLIFAQRHRRQAHRVARRKHRARTRPASPTRRRGAPDDMPPAGGLERKDAGHRRGDGERAGRYLRAWDRAPWQRELCRTSPIYACPGRKPSM